MVLARALCLYILRKQEKRHSSLWFQIEEAGEAKEKLVKSNLRLVASVAKHYRYRGVDFRDLIQEGNMGLMKAVKKFDAERGNKFSPYVMWWLNKVGQFVRQSPPVKTNVDFIK